MSSLLTIEFVNDLFLDVGRPVTAFEEAPVKIYNADNSRVCMFTSAMVRLRGFLRAPWRERERMSSGRYQLSLRDNVVGSYELSYGSTKEFTLTDGSGGELRVDKHEAARLALAIDITCRLLEQWGIIV